MPESSPFGPSQIGGAYARLESGMQTGEATGKTVHAPRRTGVGNLDCTGLPETVAMKISGCKAWTRFDRYNITREEDLRKVVKWLILYIQRKRVTVSLEYRTYLISLLCQSLHLSKNNGGEISKP